MQLRPQDSAAISLEFPSKLIPVESTFALGVNLSLTNFINESGNSNYVTGFTCVSFRNCYNCTAARHYYWINCNAYPEISLMLCFSVPKETWFHLTTSWQLSTKTLKVYVNSSLIGTRVSTTSVDVTYLTNNHDHYDIGGKGDSPNNSFHGQIQDLAVFGRVLTQEEISGVFRELS